jgi:hypothetical protein
VVDVEREEEYRVMIVLSQQSRVLITILVKAEHLVSGFITTQREFNLGSCSHVSNVGTPAQILA